MGVGRNLKGGLNFEPSFPNYPKGFIFVSQTISPCVSPNKVLDRYLFSWYNNNILKKESQEEIKKNYEKDL